MEGDCEGIVDKACGPAALSLPSQVLFSQMIRKDQAIADLAVLSGAVEPGPLLPFELRGCAGDGV